MSAELATATRQRQARALLDGMHPARFEPLPESLLKPARESVLGRRLLARFALNCRPALFAPDQERWESWSASEIWLQWPQARLQSFARMLGVIALGPALRVVVERRAVLFVRDVFGSDQWRQAQLALAWKGNPPEAIRQMGTAVLHQCGHDAEKLNAAVNERGRTEFLAHAERRHADLATRLAMSYARTSPGSCSRESWLPLTAVADLLAAQAATDALLLQAQAAVQEESSP